MKSENDAKRFQILAAILVTGLVGKLLDTSKDVSDPGVFWAMVEALATLAGLVTIGIALVSYFRQTASMSFEAFRKADELLWSKRYRRHRDEFFKLVKQYKRSDPSNPEILRVAHLNIREVLRDLSVVQRMFELKYLDRELFFYAFADRLARITKDIIFVLNLHDEIPRFGNELSRFPKGYVLLLDAREWNLQRNDEADNRLGDPRFFGERE